MTCAEVCSDLFRSLDMVACGQKPKAVALLCFVCFCLQFVSGWFWMAKLSTKLARPISLEDHKPNVAVLGSVD